jgi:hypothetical protein
VGKMDKDSIPYQLITKMNEAKNMRNRWEELYDEIGSLVKQLSEEDVKFLFKHVTDLVLKDIIFSGLAECWAESMHYYHILNPDDELPELVTPQDSYYLDDLLNELRIITKDR